MFREVKKNELPIILKIKNMEGEEDKLLMVDSINDIVNYGKEQNEFIRFILDNYLFEEIKIERYDESKKEYRLINPYNYQSRLEELIENGEILDTILKINKNNKNKSKTFKLLTNLVKDFNIQNIKAYFDEKYGFEVVEECGNDFVAKFHYNASCKSVKYHRENFLGLIIVKDNNITWKNIKVGSSSTELYEGVLTYSDIKLEDRWRETSKSMRVDSGLSEYMAEGYNNELNLKSLFELLCKLTVLELRLSLESKQSDVRKPFVQKTFLKKRFSELSEGHKNIIKSFFNIVGEELFVIDLDNRNDLEFLILPNMLGRSYEVEIYRNGTHIITLFTMCSINGKKVWKNADHFDVYVEDVQTGDEADKKTYKKIRNADEDKKMKNKDYDLTEHNYYPRSKPVKLNASYDSMKSFTDSLDEILDNKVKEIRYKEEKRRIKIYGDPNGMHPLNY